MLTLDRLTDGDLHTLTDYAELLCLQKLDRVLSCDDLRDQLRDEADYRISDDRLIDVIDQVRWRAAAFSTNYPFAIDPCGRAFSVVPSQSEGSRAYAFLLLCANLAYIQSTSIKPLTDAFERAAFCALRNIWPQDGTVVAFGKNISSYTGTKLERIKALAIDMGGRPEIKSDPFRAGDSGDGGVDLAAWLRLDPAEPENTPAALAQCACSRREWSRKQYEISRDRLEKQFRPTVPWLQMIFIPIREGLNKFRFLWSDRVNDDGCCIA